MFFSLFFLLTTAQNTEHHISNKHKECPKVGERADQWPQSLKKAMVVRPWVFILPHVSRLYTWEVSNLETPTDTDQKIPIKRLLSVTEGPGKGQPSNKETVRQQHFDSAVHHRKKCGSIPTYTSLVEALVFHLCQVL